MLDPLSHEDPGDAHSRRDSRPTWSLTQRRAADAVLAHPHVILEAISTAKSPQGRTRRWEQRALGHISGMATFKGRMKERARETAWTAQKQACSTEGEEGEEFQDISCLHMDRRPEQ